jgi:hypothetical protein
LLLENNSPFVVQSALEVLYFLPQKEALFLVFTKTQYPHPRRVRQSAYRVLERWAEQQERE